MQDYLQKPWHMNADMLWALRKRKKAKACILTKVRNLHLVILEEYLKAMPIFLHWQAPTYSHLTLIELFIINMQISTCSRRERLHVEESSRLRGPPIVKEQRFEV